MPPKKRRNLIVNAHAQPGVGRRHLNENFSTLPATSTELKKGHVLHLYVSAAGSNRAETARQLKTHFSSEGFSFRKSLSSDKRVVVTATLNKYKQLTDPKEFEQFSAICDEPFDLTEAVDPEFTVPVAQLPVPQVPVVSPGIFDEKLTVEQTDSDTMTRTPDSHLQVHSDPGSSANSRSRRRGPLTPQEAKMKQQLDFMSSTHRRVKKRYQEKVRELRRQLQTPRRCINQAIKRQKNRVETRNKEIKKLKDMLYTNVLYHELQKERNHNKKLKDTHRKLLKRRKSSKTVSVAEYNEVLIKMTEKDNVISELLHELLLLQQRVKDLTSTTEHPKGPKVNRKTYSSAMRMKVYDCISSKVSTANIPVVLQSIAKHDGIELKTVPQRSTVELMVQELGVISQLQTAEMILANNNVTLGFDATTQEGTHVNEIHFSTEHDSMSAAVDELAGGTAEDYCNHICQTVDDLAHTYVFFTKGTNFEETRAKLIEKISNTMTDRCATNHAAVRLVSSEWGKTLNEMNCHLHPLDSIATACTSALKKVEETEGNVYGGDCMAANVILSFSKLRYKDGKGDPRGFATFLDQKKLPRGILPRYRGNRFHVLFHSAGVLIEHYEVFSELLKDGTTLERNLRESLCKDFSSEIAQVELQVLGIIGKHLTGPWMTKLYTPVVSGISHVDGIELVKQATQRLKEMLQDPLQILSSTEDFFGQEIVLGNTLAKLRAMPHHRQFVPMMSSCLQATIDVLERQYAKYFTLEVTEKLREETASVRCHNMDSEELMGMFSAFQKKAPHATVSFLSARMRACKNKTVEYLEELDDKRRELVLEKAVRWGRIQTDRKRVTRKELRLELIRRQKDKQQKRKDIKRKKV
ncbi:uncharacterized protein LOC114912179 [Scleropages formosus]|uniref:uncharacterized protein LOC114912179 n=1 Tax=Scleropages formosus TaxID=113540 RepID=UPI0010FA8B22|nr:uncharacterized protein LOC114912179 [Scleropages formosus]XP_029113603.1 uncharacterized protein LOC114912179 [Scleropages formosus]XP_029113604.1 uncharacterized protein LOC114912179 [Scleropages formosus]